MSELTTDPAAKAQIDATIYHEMGHDCLNRNTNGGGCFDPSGETQDICDEIIADAYALNRLAEAIKKLCTDICALEAIPNRTPQQDQDLADKKAEAKALCEAMQNIRDSYGGSNAEKNFEAACTCAAGGFPGVVADASKCDGLEIPPLPAVGSVGNGTPDGAHVPGSTAACDYPKTKPGDPGLFENYPSGFTTCKADGSVDCGCSNNPPPPPPPPPSPPPF